MRVSCFSFGNRPTADTYALDVSLQMRRGELPRPIARRSQHRLEHRRDTALPIRPCNVDVARRALGVAAHFSRLGNTVEPELDAARLQAVEPMKRFSVPSHPDRYSTRRATLARMS